jgi:hypothetical protein
VAAWLSSQLGPGDIVFADFPVDAQIRFYASRYGLPLNQFRKYEQRDYQRVIVLVNPVKEQSLKSVVMNHRAMKTPPDLSSAQPLTVIDDFQVYALSPGKTQ